MTTVRVFADTFYWIALANAKDPFHGDAQRLTSPSERRGLVTTEEVLSEFLTWYSGQGVRWRHQVAAIVRDLFSDPAVEISPLTHDRFMSALALYEKRPDKSYSLTDCSSMCVMKTLGLSDVLTHDRHFAQKGFHLLFPDQPTP